MDPAAREWWHRRTSSASDWPLEQVLAAKQATTIAVVIPARNEEATVGDVVGQIRADLGALVDELVVMDSLSDDATATVAAAAGARVCSVAEVRADLGVRRGKGEALWKSLFVTTSDLLVFIDADLSEWGTHFVTGLVGPLLADREVLLAKGFYDRILDMGTGVSTEGGRVTELVARPWRALHRPELSAVVQPLAGEWAIRRSLFERLSVPVGYGVEMATLLDTHERHGLDAIAQVDLGRRAHVHQHLHDLSAMAVEVLATAERRRGGSLGDAVVLPHLSRDREWAERNVPTSERPPAVGLLATDPPA
jgi:glucosyl-3-phosphoglycerate synthase